MAHTYVAEVFRSPHIARFVQGTLKLVCFLVVELQEKKLQVDSWADANLKSAQKQRVEGSPIKLVSPSGYPQWMLAPDKKSKQYL